MELADFEELRIINGRLALMYGSNVNVQKPNFRLIQVEDCLEKRAGEIHYGKVFLKEDVREIKKYPWLDDGWWMIERLVPNVLGDVIEGGYSYEPIYCFKIFPIWRAVEFLIYNLFHPAKQHPKTEKQAWYEYKEDLEKKKIAARDMIDTTPLETSLNDGSALSYSNTEGIDYRPSHIPSEIQNEVKE